MMLRDFARITLLAALFSVAGCATDALIVTQPEGASVYCNSEYVGKSPCKVPYPQTTPDGMEGMNVIEVRKDGYLPEYYYLSPPEEGTFAPSEKINIPLVKLAADIKIPELATVDEELAPSIEGPFMGLISIEARAYRVKDMRCIGQVSLYTTKSLSSEIATDMACEFAEILPKDKNIAIKIVSLRNRRMTTFGKELAESLTGDLAREICFCGGLPDIESINLRKDYKENQLDTQAMLKEIKSKGKLYRADYVIIGGVAECVRP